MFINDIIIINNNNNIIIMEHQDWNQYIVHCKNPPKDVKMVKLLKKVHKDTKK